MKPKQNKNNSSNNKNNKHQQQDRQTDGQADGQTDTQTGRQTGKPTETQTKTETVKTEQQQQTKQEIVKTVVKDDVRDDVTDVGEMTSSTAEFPVTSSNLESSKSAISKPVSDSNGETLSVVQPGNSSTSSGHVTTPNDVTEDHVTTDCRLRDDDVEVADILHQQGDLTSTPEVMTLGDDPEVKDDEKVNTIEVIMSKTFTESTQPEREFVPIDDDTELLPVTTRLTVQCELNRQASSSSQGSPTAVATGLGQVRELTSELRHLQSMLDHLSDRGDNEDASSDEELGENWMKSAGNARVLYRYHLRGLADPQHQPHHYQQQHHVMEMVKRTGEAGPPVRRWVASGNGATSQTAVNSDQTEKPGVRTD